KAWTASMAAFRKDLRTMERLVSDRKVDLCARIPWGDGQTILREALLVADHNAYHLGQLVMLRKSIGIWARGASWNTAETQRTPRIPEPFKTEGSLFFFPKILTLVFQKAQKGFLAALGVSAVKCFHAGIDAQSGVRGGLFRNTTCISSLQCSSIPSTSQSISGDR